MPSARIRKIIYEKRSVKRLFKFNGLDTKLNITKVVEVDVERKFYYLEEYKTDEYRLTYSKAMFAKPLKELTSIEVIRVN